MSAASKEVPEALALTWSGGTVSCVQFSIFGRLDLVCIDGLADAASFLVEFLLLNG